MAASNDGERKTSPRVPKLMDMLSKAKMRSTPGGPDSTISEKSGSKEGISDYGQTPESARLRNRTSAESQGDDTEGPSRYTGSSAKKQFSLKLKQSASAQEAEKSDSDTYSSNSGGEQAAGEKKAPVIVASDSDSN